MTAAPHLQPLPRLPRGACLWLAYSGGLDSTALLHLLTTRKTARLTAVHVHHGLQDAAEDWARQCRAQCRRLGVAFKLLHVKVDARDPAGPEAAARVARYAALAQQMRPGDLLITAHHRDDQAETVLLRLLRGTGINGLAAMQPLADFASGQLWRPLLELPRAQLLEYARAQGLQWMEDPHNADPRYARSWLRAQVMPLLRQRWPQADESLARAAQHAAQAQELLDERAAEDLRRLSAWAGQRLARPKKGTVVWAERSEAHAESTLSVAGLLKLATARRFNVLRYWLSLNGFQAPSSSMLERLDQEVLRARADANPLLNAGAYEFRRYRDSLYVLAPLRPEPQNVLNWDGTGELVLPPGCGVLASGARRRRAFTVRFARGGERLKPAGDSHTRTLKYLFQQAGVPPWLRTRVPLIYQDDELLSAAGLWTVEMKSPGLRIHWRPAT